MNSPAPASSHQARPAAWTFWFPWALATLAKLFFSLEKGTADVFLYAKYGYTLAKSGFVAAYDSSPIYNIPPVAAGYAALLSQWCADSFMAFGFWLRFPGIAAEAALAAVLWQMLRTRGARFHWVPLAVVANPVAFYVTGYHGNLDGLMAAFIGAALVTAWRGLPLWSGVWLGLACNLKVAPILIAPVFFFWWLVRGQGLRFFVACSVVTLVGWSPGLLLCPDLFLRRVLMYDSLWGTWGVSRWLLLTGNPAFNTIQYGAPSALGKIISRALKLSIIGGVLAMSWRRRVVSAEGLACTLAGAWMLFFVLSPGGAPQYLVWLVLPLLLVRLWAGLAYFAACFPLCFVIYRDLAPHLFPVRLFKDFRLPNLMDFAYDLGLMIWVLLAVLLVRFWPKWWRVEGQDLAVAETPEKAVA